MTFEEICKKFDITPVQLETQVTPDVYNILLTIADEKGKELDDIIRDIIDNYLMEMIL